MARLYRGWLHAGMGMQWLIVFYSQIDFRHVHQPMPMRSRHMSVDLGNYFFCRIGSRS